jgi:hypothetical protein
MTTMTDERRRAAKLVGICKSKERRWDEYVQQATSVNPLDMNAGELANEVYDLQNLVCLAVAEIKSLLNTLHSAADPRVLH